MKDFLIELPVFKLQHGVTAGQTMGLGLTSTGIHEKIDFQKDEERQT